MLYCLNFSINKIEMKVLYKIISLFFVTQILLGCASQTAKMAHKINNDSENNYNSKK